MDAEWIGLDTFPEYPSVWFNKNKGKKPPLTIRDNTAGDLHALIKDGNKFTTKWDDVMMTSFMVKVIQENPQIFEHKLEEEWKTMDITIGTVGDVITPLDLLELNVLEKLAVPPNPDTGNQSTRLGLFYAFLILYRKKIALKKPGNYSKKIANKLNTTFSNTKFVTGANYNNSLNHFKIDECMTLNYKRLLCAIDMFFFKFNKEEYAIMRIATLPTRFKGCSPLTSLDQVSKYCGLHPTNMVHFAVSDPIRNELRRVLKEGESMSDPHSYFPYHLEMGLVTRSPYTIDANPALYLWIHTIGALNGMEGSMKARMPASPRDVDNCVIAACALYLFREKGCQFERKFFENGEISKRVLQARITAHERLLTVRQQLSVEEHDGSENGDQTTQPLIDSPAVQESGQPTSAFVDLSRIKESALAKRAEAMTKKLRTNGGLTEQQQAEIKCKFQNCSVHRKGTIGQFLSTYFG